MDTIMVKEVDLEDRREAWPLCYYEFSKNGLSFSVLFSDRYIVRIFSSRCINSTFIEKIYEVSEPVLLIVPV